LAKAKAFGEEYSTYARFDDDREPDAPIGDLMYPELDVPLDNEGYCVSWPSNKEKEIKQFFSKYGFVVVRNVLTEQEVSNSVSDIWTQLETGKFDQPTELDIKINRNDPSTWGIESGWPAFFTNLGFLGQPRTKQLWMNRVNENIYNSFKTVIGNPNLWVAIEQIGAMRPTKGISAVPLEPNNSRVNASPKIGTGAIDKKDWVSTKGSDWIHWDLNPWKWTTGQGMDYAFTDFSTENNGVKKGKYVKVQGVLNLGASSKDDGGFFCVPGFQKYVADWAQKTKHTRACKKKDDILDLVHVPLCDKIRSQGKKVPMRPGSLLIWNSELPHANYPNSSSNFRFVQYFKMFVANPDAKGVSYRRNLIKMNVPRGIELTDLGKKLYGLESWSNQIEQ